MLFRSVVGLGDDPGLVVVVPEGAADFGDDIAAGEELFFDYRLVIDERYTAKLKKAYACRCGAPDCRGTMLGPKR